MFRSFIYVNTGKIYEYYSLLDETIKEKIVSMERSTTNKVGVLAKPIGIERSKTEIMKSEISQYFLSDYNKFEKELEKLDGENYFDFDEYFEKYDISKMPRASIGKIQTNFYIPEEFDYIELIGIFKPLLMSSLNIKESEHDLYDAFLGEAKADIPIIIDFDNHKLCAKLDTRFLNEEYNQLDEYETEDVTILFKLNTYKSGSKITIFDPMKDFIKLNRAMRRSADIQSSYTEEIAPIIVDGSIIKVEILAIYK